MFSIKICGITSVADGVASARAGADAVGLNFHAASPRCVSIDTAAQIARNLPNSVARVGVFVNDSAERILQIVERVGLDWIQLHGDEPAEFTFFLRSRTSGVRIAKAFRLEGAETAAIGAYLAKCRQAALPLDALLVDAHRPGLYGGTGETVDWGTLSPPRGWALDTPLILAGGLHPDNIALAIAKVRPAAVDVASGVEFAPGRKEVMLVESLLARAREAFDAPPRGDA
jgi:phosphoribosylanthranilate isomerase